MGLGVLRPPRRHAEASELAATSAVGMFVSGETRLKGSDNFAVALNTAEGRVASDMGDRQMVA
jgi:hypothetical protein